MKPSFADNKEFINGINELILENLGNEKFSVDELARLAGMSRSNLNRRLHSISRLYAGQFIREVRLHKALEMLQKGTLTASEVSYSLGFSSPAYFNKCFHDYYGYNPGKVKKMGIESQEENIQTHIPEKHELKKGVRSTLEKNRSKVLFFVALISIVSIGTFQKISTFFRPDNLINFDDRISVMVMPFQNRTNDTLWNVWQDGIQTNLSASLSNFGEFKVRQIENIKGLLNSLSNNYNAVVNLSLARKVSRKLGANVFVYGVINKAGSNVRLNTQLVNAKTEEDIKSFQIDGTSENIIQMIDYLSVMIKNTLMIYNLGKGVPLENHERYLSSIGSPDAYRYFVYGNLAFYKNNFTAAREWFEQSLNCDSNLIGAMGKISRAYYNEGKYEQAKEWCSRYYSKLDLMTLQEKIAARGLYALFFQTLNDRVTNLRQLIDFDEQNPIVYFNIGDCYFEMFEYEKAIPEFEKALDIFREWGIKPYWGAFYYELGISYHKTGQFRKEKRLYRKADKDFPDDPELMDQHAWLALRLGDTVSASKYIAKWISMRKEQSWSDGRIASYMAYIYSMADIPDKEEEFHRKALSLEPDNIDRMNLLAYFLIDKESNIEEGIKLSERALMISPVNYHSMFIKGWGLFKQGKTTESLELLQKSWDLRMQKSIYKHQPFLVLEEAKNAMRI